MIYSGKISELVKTLESVKKKEPKLSQYISLMLKRIQYLYLEPSLPKTYKDGLTHSIILPDGNQGNFAFNSDKISLALVYSSVTRDYVTKDKTRFLIHPCVTAYFRYDDGTFTDFGKVALVDYVYNDELGSAKAKYISSKAKSAIIRIVKMNPDKIEAYLKSIHKG